MVHPTPNYFLVPIPMPLISPTVMIRRRQCRQMKETRFQCLDLGKTIRCVYRLDRPYEKQCFDKSDMSNLKL